MIDFIVKPKKGATVLHFAAERGLYEAIKSRVGEENYKLVDFNPGRVATRLNAVVSKFDMCKDTSTLEAASYDLIIHNHVLEHIFCNYTCILQGLQKALKPNGYQLFTAPIINTYYREDTNLNKSEKDRIQQFKQKDHVRIFGRLNFDETLGMAIGIKSDYSVASFIPEEALVKANIPEQYWKGVSGSSVFALRGS